jgi:hypothetical protein
MKGFVLLLTLFLTSVSFAEDLEATTINSSGGSDGSIDLTITGGIAPYVIDWTGPGAFTASTEDISGLDPGSYTVTVTDSYCGTAVLTIEVGTVGIEEESAIGISLYPNPVSSILTISTEAEIDRIIVLDNLGRTVLDVPFTAELNISYLSVGVYHIGLFHSEGIGRSTFVVD